MKFGLQGIRALLNSTGNPHTSFSSIHIAGTNGKGSTASMIAAMLTAAGYKTGLYTSPHVVDFTERIRINGKPIPQRDVVEILRKLKPLVRRNKATFFETVTAIAFHFFAQRKVDIAVIETGLGGRLDATNVIEPLISVITTIGLDHTEILGKTISKIASEKAGIIKPGIPCVVGVLEPVARQVIKKIARQRSSALIRTSAKIKIISSGINGTQFDVKTGRTQFKKLTLSLAGIHQVANAILALKTVQQLDKIKTIHVPESAIRKGLARVQLYSGLQSRLSLVHRNPLIIADVAHNPDAVSALVRSLQDLSINSVILVFGVSADKDFLRMAQLLKPIVDRAIVVSAKTERARRTRDIVQALTEQHIPAEVEIGVQEGLQRAMRLTTAKQPILVTGSHFVVGEALAFLQKKKYLTINQ